MKQNYKNYTKIIILPLCILLIIYIITIGFNYSHALYTKSQEASGTITVPENNYCINNGFNKLSDCMLVMENYSTSTENAKSYITSKGTPDFTKTAPQMTFRETTTTKTDDNGVLSSKNHYSLGKGYTFNEETGNYTLTDYVSDNMDAKYIDYYTCGATPTSWTSCSTIYQVKAYKENTNIITSVVTHNGKVVDSFDSEIGLYAINDDLGTSYYYRGDVQNNYVSYAGYIWRIIRENGNGTVRMIYQGLSPNSSGGNSSIGYSYYNNKSSDLTHLGYMYSEDFELHTTDTTWFPYFGFGENDSYYFGTDYTFNEQTKKFSLTGELIEGRWEDIYDTAIHNYPYTCFGITDNNTCDIMLKVVGYKNSYTAFANVISYSSKSYESTLNNTTSSDVKNKIDVWFQQNILAKTDSSGNSYANYLSDEVFCNDRSITSGSSGYLLSATTTYNPSIRLHDATPSLSCSQMQDRFSVSQDKGNGNLTYPIALITVDELMLAGGVMNRTNPKYYLSTNTTSWTMSPLIFGRSTMGFQMSAMLSSGYLHTGLYIGRAGYSIRPVLNLSADIRISGGDGTAINPYIVTLE